MPLPSLTDPSLDDLIEVIIAWTHRTLGEAEIIAAVGRYHQENGKVFHDDSFFDTRTSYFFDMLLFERPVGGRTPYEQFLAHARSAREPLPPLAIERLTWLGDCRHSLFQILRIQERTIEVQDLLFAGKGGKILVTVKANETFRGLDKRNLLQGFVYKFGDQHQLSSGLILHPQKVTRVIKRFLKNAQKSGDFSRRAALARLASVNIRYLRRRHVDPKTIYLGELK